MGLPSKSKGATHAVSMTWVPFNGPSKATTADRLLRLHGAFGQRAGLGSTETDASDTFHRRITLSQGAEHAVVEAHRLVAVISMSLL